MQTETCSFCGAAVIRAPLVTGGVVDLDPEPHPDGDIALMPAGAMVLPERMVEAGKKIGSKRYRAHVRTCPTP